MATEDAVAEGVDADRHDVSASRFAPIAAGGDAKSDATSVEQYTEEDSDLYDAIVASLLQTRSQRLNEEDGDGNVRVPALVPTETPSSSSRKQKENPCSGSSVTEAGEASNSKPYPSSSRKRKERPSSGSSVIEPGQPSNSDPDPSFVCEICAVPRTKKDLLRITGCGHPCCSDCVAKYVASKLHDKVTLMDCPVSGCGGVLEPAYCSSILPPEVFDSWGKALCEVLILEKERYYCPFSDCSALLIDDGGAVLRESECPNCWRLFCAQCRVPWHAGLECQEFQGLSEEAKGTEDRKKKPCSGLLVIEADQPSNSEPGPPFTCEICVELRTNSDLFRIKGCSHAYCSDCVTKYVTAKLDDNVTRIDCPVSGCGGFLELEYCRSILPSEVFDRWGNALCEGLILEAERFYCPFKDCSALLINDGGEVVRESECPSCRRLFCGQCRVPWHAGVECQEFQELNEGERMSEEDMLLMQLAEKKQWRRCPKCRFIVQKKSGCAFVKCRCGVEFCYQCGAETKVSHYCNNCRR
ncbi:hypothetical protein BT93_F2688 [Corymbia citriodora subsp. variegata]|nr:hypothetical protein BT93_F2688 [Corymbia citriodora subsp. variegata]